MIPVLLVLAYTVQILVFEVQSILSDPYDMLELIVPVDELEDVISEEELLDLLPFTDEPVQQEPREDSIFDIIADIEVEQLNEIITDSIGFILIFIDSLISLFFILLIAFAVSFYLHTDGQKIHDYFVELVNNDKLLMEFYRNIDKELKYVFIGNIALALITGLIGVVSFTVLSIILPGGDAIPYPGLLGILCGIGSLIPVIGMKIVYIPVTLYILVVQTIESVSIAEGALVIMSALFDFRVAVLGGFFDGIIDIFLVPFSFGLVALIIVDTIPDLIARPYIGSYSGVPSGLLLFAYIFGPITLGWYGLFLGPIVFIVFYEYFKTVLVNVDLSNVL